MWFSSLQMTVSFTQVAKARLERCAAVACLLSTQKSPGLTIKDFFLVEMVLDQQPSSGVLIKMPFSPKEIPSLCQDVGLLLAGICLQVELRTVWSDALLHYSKS